MTSPSMKDKGLYAAYRRINERRAAGEGEGGFTLIELLIVIVVLGILAAVVIFSLGGVTGKSALAACQADGATLSTAIAAFNAENPGVTVTVADLLPPTTSTTGANSNSGYIQSWPSNLPHYAYGIISGVLYLEVPGDSTWTSNPTTSVTGVTVVPYTGPQSCSKVS